MADTTADDERASASEVSFGDQEALAYGSSRLGTLPSGARLALVPLPAAGSTLVAVVIPVGAADDPAGEAGVAHLVEHLWFSVRDAEGRSLDDRLSALGAPFQGITTPDAVVFAAAAPRDHAGEVIQWLSAPLFGDPGAIEPEVVARELAIVAREWRDRGARLHDGVEATGAGAFFPKKGRYNPRGREQETAFGRLGLKEVEAEIARFHHLPGATLVVAGKLPVYDEVIAALPPALLAASPDAHLPAVDPDNRLPAPLVPWRGLAEHTPDESPTDPWLLRGAGVSDPAILWSWLLPAPPGRSHGERLAARALVGLALGADCDLSPTRSFTLLSCADEPRAGAWPDLEAAERASFVDQVVSTVADVDPGTDEAAAWLDQLRDRAAHVAALDYLAELEQISSGDPSALAKLALWLHFSGLDATPRSVARSLKSLDLQELARGYRGRLREDLVASVGVVPAGSAYAAPVLVPPPDSSPAVPPPLPTLAPSGAAVGGGWRSEVLPNGLRVLIVPDLAFPVVHAALVVRTGGAQLIADPSASLAWKAALVPRGEDVGALIDRSVWFAGDREPGAWIYGLNGPSSSFRVVLDALAERTSVPRVDASLAWAALPGMLSRPGDGTAAALTRFEALLGVKVAARGLPTPASAQAILRHQWRPNEALLVIVGRVDADTAARAIQGDDFAGWQQDDAAAPKARPAPAPDVVTPPLPTRRADLWGIPDVADAALTLDLRTSAMDTASEPALLVLEQLVGAALREEARSRRAIAYSPVVTYNRAGPAAWLTAALDVAPEHVSAAREAVEVTLRRLAGGPDPVEVANARAAALASWRASAQGPGVIALAARTFAEGGDVGALARFDPAIGTVDGAALQAMLAGWEERQVLTVLTRTDAVAAVKAALPDAVVHNGGRR